MASETATQDAGWPLRIWVLMALGALFALAIQQLGDPPDSELGLEQATRQRRDRLPCRERHRVRPLVAARTACSRCDHGGGLQA